jgi:hypothetical protein
MRKWITEEEIKSITPLEMTGWYDPRQRGMFGPFATKEEAEQHRHGLGSPVGKVFYMSATKGQANS